MRDAVNAVVEVDHSSTLHVQSVTQNALLTGEEVKHASHTLVVKSMAQHESRLPRVRSTLTLRTAASISSLRTTSRLHAPTPSKAAAPVASARAGPSLTRKPSTRLDTSAKRTATTSTTMTGSVRPAPAPASRPAAPVARPAATRPLPPDPPAKAPRPAHARSMVQPPKVHVRTSPKSHAVMPPLARRVVSKPDLLQPTQRILSSSNMAPPKPVRRVLSTAEALPLSPKKTIKPTPVTPARKVPLVADTPLLPRLVSRPFPASTMQMIKDEERPFGDEPIGESPVKVTTQPTATSHAVKVALLAKDAAEKERDALREEIKRIRGARDAERWRFVIAQGEEALKGEKTLRRMIDLARRTILEQTQADALIRDGRDEMP